MLIPTKFTQSETTEASVVDDRSKTVEQLAKQVRLLETAGRQLHGQRVSSGCAAMDAVLPDGGYARGTLVEYLHDGPGSGAVSLVMLAARQAMAAGKYLIVVDPQRRFYPPAAVAFGISLERIIVVHTSNRADTLWSFDQALRSPSVGAVWSAIDQFDDRQARRFQLAAEAGGAIGFLTRDIRIVRNQPSWADVQWQVTPCAAPEEAGDANNRWLDLHLRRCRGGRSGLCLSLMLNGHTGQLEQATERKRPALPLSATASMPQQLSRSKRTASKQAI